MNIEPQLKERLEKVGIGRGKHHIFLCTGPKCCSEAEGEKVWEYLKQRNRELQAEGVFFHRTRAACLRVCQQGPIVVIYPEGVWYRMANVENLERIIDQHIRKGQEVSELKIADSFNL